MFELFGGVEVHLLLKGRLGQGWVDVDRRLRVPEGSTLADLIRIADGKGIPLSEALETSPHLAHTLMLNGERCPIADNRDRVLGEGDRVYLLSPLAGG
jgi:sulfur carrier protein ThiS